MRVLVTGGSGFLGGSVVPMLVEAGHEVAALARSRTSADRVASLGTRPIKGDLDDAESTVQAFQTARPEALVNLASLGFGHADTIINAAQRAGVGRAVFVSTTAIFTSLNSKSRSIRLAAERSIETSGLGWTIIRPTMIYGGPGDRNMWRLLRFIRRTPIVPAPGGGSRLQQPVHVDDLASAIVAAAATEAAQERSYDVGGPESITFRTVIEHAAQAVGVRPRILPVPGRALATTLRLIERGGLRAPIRAEQIERLLEDKTFDISAAHSELGFTPRSFACGIAQEAALVT